jgi:hypothetical protein
VDVSALSGQRLIVHGSTCQRRDPAAKASELAGFLRKIISARSWQRESWPAIEQLVTVIRWFDGRAAKTSRVADRPMLVIELARVVWRDTVAVLESDDGGDDSTPEPVDDGCDDSMRQPCSEYEARAFLASELAQRQLIRMHALAEAEAAAEPGETAAAAEQAAAPHAAPRAARSKRPRDQNDEKEADRASFRVYQVQQLVERQAVRDSAAEARRAAAAKAKAKQAEAEAAKAVKVAAKQAAAAVAEAAKGVKAAAKQVRHTRARTRARARTMTQTMTRTRTKPEPEP